MSKLVILSLGEGNLYKGFPNVIVQLGKPDDPRLMEFRGSLPAAAQIPELYRDWQLLYSTLYRRFGWTRRIEIEEADVTNVSEVEFNDLRKQLSDKINDWLNCVQFHRIDQILRTQLDPSEEIRFMIATNDNLLRRLPWHLWNFFEDYPNAEVALSPLEFQRSRRTVVKNKSDKIKILAILGNSKGIDISKDKAFLEKLSNKAKIEFLVEPQRRELNQKLLETWDILFFAGHSSSQGKGVIQINQGEEISLDKLRNALKKAIEHGLKLAIFNSCDGLGLAQALEDLHIPQVIVMREPVPDVVAQEFLRHFLAQFASGKSLYAAVREARERLEALEGEYPCATWFPVICQNPAEEPIAPPSQGISVTYTKNKIKIALLVSLVVTAWIVGMRYLGILEPWELQAFDRLMRLRPAVELPDERLLIVTIDEADIQYQISKGMQMQWSLSDEALALLLQKLDKYQPRTIGLDVYRDFPVDPKYPDLANRLQKDNRLFAVCKVYLPENSTDDNGTPPPPEIPGERLTFTDFVEDKDEIVRRQLLNLTVPNVTSPCVADNALNFILALHYLNTQGIKYNVSQIGQVQVGDVKFKQLKESSGGYQSEDTSGYQMLLNYRSLPSPQNIALPISLTDILSDRIQPDLVEKLKDRIVIVGVTAPTTVDFWKTPYSASLPSNQKQIPGVFMQAQMVSQILSAVLDKRPLFWWWSDWVETIWIWGWSLVGATIVWFHKPSHLVIAVATALVLLFGICVSIFTMAGWVPLVPSGLAIVATAVAFILFRASMNRKYR